MNRIEARFQTLREQGRCALIPFVTAGDPGPELTTDVLHALAASGADLIELGMPFSDPMADGPVIQQANERALAKHVGLRHVLDAVRAFRERDARTPIVLMGYLNPIECFGTEAFVAAAAGAGVDGMLIVDCPIEESAALTPLLAQHRIERIQLIAPTTPAERRKRIAEAATGFVYYVSFKGITGADRFDATPVRVAVEQLRTWTRTPVAAGFGIRDAASAAQLADVADAVVIGSALVERLAKATDAASVREIAYAFLAPIRAALDASRSAVAA